MRKKIHKLVKEQFRGEKRRFNNRSKPKPINNDDGLNHKLTWFL